jgi:hypothetical protein
MGENWKTVVLSRTTEFQDNPLYIFSRDLKEVAAARLLPLDRQALTYNGTILKEFSTLVLNIGFVLALRKGMRYQVKSGLGPIFLQCYTFTYSPCNSSPTAIYGQI